MGLAEATGCYAWGLLNERWVSQWILGRWQFGMVHTRLIRTVSQNPVGSVVSVGWAVPSVSLTLQSTWKKWCCKHNPGLDNYIRRIRAACSLFFGEDPNKIWEDISQKEKKHWKRWTKFTVVGCLFWERPVHQTLEVLPMPPVAPWHAMNVLNPWSGSQSTGVRFAWNVLETHSYGLFLVSQTKGNDKDFISRLYFVN